MAVAVMVLLSGQEEQPGGQDTRVSQWKSSRLCRNDCKSRAADVSEKVPRICDKNRRATGENETVTESREWMELRRGGGSR